MEKLGTTILLRILGVTGDPHLHSPLTARKNKGVPARLPLNDGTIKQVLEKSAELE